MPSTHLTHLIRLLRGSDSLSKAALPIGEFFHPLSLLAVLILLGNDWWLKPSAWPSGLVTGKLSDFAGLLFFPLLLTALIDCLLWAIHKVTGLPLDFSLRRFKLMVAIGFTGALFTATKLVPQVSRFVVDTMREVGLPAHITMDPFDLIALPVLWISWRIGCGEIARLPLGRLAVLLHHKPVSEGAMAAALADVRKCGGDADVVDGLSRSLAIYNQCPSGDNARAVNTLLDLLRS